MSTESPSTALGASDHDPDLEYASTPPGAKYEHTDIDPAIGYKFALWLTASMVVSFAIVYGALVFFERQEKRANAAAQLYPLSTDFERPRPTPALQTQPFMDVYTLRQSESDRLNSYGWVDKEGGVARIPIDRAMDVLLQRGLPIRSDSPADAKNVVTQDSSSGRTVVPR